MQALVLLHKLFEFALLLFRHRAQGDGLGQLLFAGQDAGLDHFFLARVRQTA